MARSTDIGPSPCESEGGCPFALECKAYRLDCRSFRHYASANPRIGVDKNAEFHKSGYRFIQDRGTKRKRIEEWESEYKKPWKEKVKVDK